jgi:hypothetical protein
VRRLFLAVVMILVPALAGADHPVEGSGLDGRTLVMWGTAAAAAGAIVLMRWLSARRRRREDAADDDADG